MARDVMSVRLWLPQVRVTGVVVDAPEPAGGAGRVDGGAPEVPALFGAEQASP